MNWLHSLAIAILLLSIQYDAVESVLPTSSNSPWTDPTKASLFMDCLLKKITESEILPQQEKEDLQSIMDTLMSAVNDANARGQSNGAQLQAIDMAIASSLAEIVVTEDAGNQTSIVIKTQELAEGLEQCFELVMGTIDRKFINKIKDLISMFANEAAAEILEEQEEEEEEEEEDSSSSSSSQTSQSEITRESSQRFEDSSQTVEGYGAENLEPQVPQAISSDARDQVSQSASRFFTGETNESTDSSTQRVFMRNGGAQQTFPTAVNPKRLYSSSYQSGQSAANSYQSSQTFQDTSQTVGGYERQYRGPPVSQPELTNAGPQTLQSPSSQNWRRANELTDTSTRRTVLRNGAPLQSPQTAIYPNRLSSSSFQTTSQSSDSNYQSNQLLQGSSQSDEGNRGTYSGPQFLGPTPSGTGPQAPQGAPELITRKANELVDSSTRRTVLRSGVPQQIYSKAIYPNRPPSSSLQTASQSVDNAYRSSQTFRDSAQTVGNYGGTYTGQQFSEPPPVAFGPQVSKPTPNAVGPQVLKEASGQISRVANEQAETSTRRQILRRRGPHRFAPTVMYPNRSSSSFQTSQSDNAYQSSQTLQGSSQSSDRYTGGTYAGPQFSGPTPVAFGPQVPNPTPNVVEPQVLQGTQGQMQRVTNEVADTSTRRVYHRRRIPHKTVTKLMLPNRSSSSSFQTNQSTDNTYQSSQTLRESSQSASGYENGAYSGYQLAGPTPAAFGPQMTKPAPPPVPQAAPPPVPQAAPPPVPQAAPPSVPQEAPSLNSRVRDEMAKTRRTMRRNRIPQQNVPTAVYPNRWSSSSIQTTRQSAANAYDSSQTFQGSSQKAGRYEGTYPRPQFSEPTPEPPVAQAAPELISRQTDEQTDASTRTVIQRGGVPQQTIPAVVYPNRSSSSSYQTISQSADSAYQSSQTFQDSSQMTDGYEGTYDGYQLSGPTPPIVEPQVSQVTLELISKVANALANSPTVKNILRRGVPEQIASYLIQRTIESLSNALGIDSNNLLGITSQAFAPLSEVSDTPDYAEAFSTVLVSSGILNESNIDYLGPPVLSAVVEAISNAARELGINENTANQQDDIRSSSSSMAASSSSTSFSQTASSFENDAASTTGLAGPGGYSGPVPSQTGLDQTRYTTNDANQGAFSDMSCITSPDISVLPTLNSPYGLRSGLAGARINQMIATVLNAVSPSGVDVYALANTLQASVSNIVSYGMSPNDAKLEALLELIVGLLQIVSNALIQGIDPTTASSVTDSAARSFELALA